MENHVTIELADGRTIEGRRIGRLANEKLARKAKMTEGDVASTMRYVNLCLRYVILKVDDHDVKLVVEPGVGAKVMSESEFDALPLSDTDVLKIMEHAAPGQAIVAAGGVAPEGDAQQGN